MSALSVAPDAPVVVARTGAVAALLPRLMVLVAAALIIAAFFAPIWWVSLKAPNYPEHTFPFGIRIHFHVDGVRNGCEVRTSKEVIEKEALDCVHEMDTINHFVGMYPIASGGPVEKTFSPFLFAFLVVLLVGFALPWARVRLAVMALGFLATAAWMGHALFAENGVGWLGRGYVHSLVTSLGQDESGSEDNLHPIVKQLRESLARSGIQVGAPPAPGRDASTAQLIEVLRTAYNRDQERLPAAERTPWTGSAMQVFAWHYEKSLGRWFNQPEKNRVLVGIMTTVAWIVLAAVLLAMPVMLWMARDDRKPWFWALLLLPAILPLAFIVEYSAWLWWYGHSLNEMGAFTLKPFMPTVFGQGKVAQFTTFSYPHYGFGLMVAASLLLTVAGLMRRRAMPA